MDAIDRIREIILLGGQLCTFMQLENRALQDRDRDYVAAHIDEKNALTRSYEKLFKSLIADETGLEEALAEYRDDLRDLNNRLQDLIAENGLLLQAAIQSGQIVLDTIAEAVRISQTDGSTYSAAGALGQNGLSARRASIAMDQTL
ncbi:MAG: hypothetical protein OQJ99_08615 [Rhodospirillales bacterium]|nr:hypothetical protein [Rhodospirillales bacterium]MCW8862657.1 hypothetical protein [Rhodospirillales bacterium]MCW8951145.1 hypothetical protein [Rhodospirillales bacterium]MCW8970885.1 hypothetical protein [Rhodospirillales bacterium]MCW9002432.1 hypothetical protein [Rhodospirillales bacterium]